MKTLKRFWKENYDRIIVVAVVFVVLATFMYYISSVAINSQNYKNDNGNGTYKMSVSGLNIPESFIYISGINFGNPQVTGIEDNYLAVNVTFVSSSGSIIGQQWGGYSLAQMYFTSNNYTVLPVPAFTFSNINSVTIQMTVYVYNQTIPFGWNGNLPESTNGLNYSYNPVSQTISYLYPSSNGSSSSTSFYISWFNNKAVTNGGALNIASSNGGKFNFSIAGNTYSEISKLTLNLNSGQYSYSAEYNGTYENGTVYVIANTTSYLNLSFNAFYVANNYKLLGFTIASVIVSLAFSIASGRKSIVFFISGFICMFIGYELKIPHITSSVLVTVVFGLVLMVIYKLVLE